MSKRSESNEFKIIFHNPNTKEQTAKALIKIIASSLVEQAINNKLHSDTDLDDLTKNYLDVMEN